jgi:Protein of unknown function (DUF1524)
MRVAATEGVEVAELDLDALTIEHLAPQGSKRPTNLDASDVARIGNLLLVTEGLNKQLGDKPFAVKQQALEGKQGVDEVHPAGEELDPQVDRGPNKAFAEASVRRSLEVLNGL